MNNDVKKKFTKSEIEMARLARNAYMRAWRKRNPEKVKGYMVKYFSKKGNEILGTVEKRNAVK